MVAAMLLLALLQLVIASDLLDEGHEGRLSPWANYLAVLLLIGPVAWRRVAPSAIALWIGVGFAVFRVLEVPEGPMSSIAVFLAVHAVGAYELERSRRDGVRLVVLAAGFAALTYSLVAGTDAVSFDSVVVVTLTVGLNVGFYITAWFLGDAARRERASGAELQRRAAQLAAERQKVAEQAVTQERVRIARELHDVVAHHVSVMGVQAAAARHVMARSPERAAEALAHVEEASRMAVEELQRLVGVLRSDAGDGVDAPQPTLSDLDTLLERMRAAGVAVQRRDIGRPRPLPASVELSAYRVVQEALTNVVRHAPGAGVTVVVSFLTDWLQVEIVNGPPRSDHQASPGGGRGLIGMRERAAMHGGTFEHGALSRGGYQVRLRLPIAPETPVPGAAPARAGQA